MAIDPNEKYALTGEQVIDLADKINAKAEETDLETLEATVADKQDALTETQLAAVNSGIDSTKVGQIATNASDIDTIEGKIPSAATAQNQLADKSYVDNADNGLQSQIDAISASSDVRDIVGTKAELNNYDTSTLGDNDIIKVLQDESENDATTYYRWSTSTNSFTLIGEEGPYYTKSQANALLDDKVDKVTGKGLSENDFTTTLKDKLDGIEAGAEVNEIDSISVNGTAVTPDANKNVDLTIDGGIKTLTSADYNYPANNPTAVALWLLEPGVYKVSSNTSVRANTNTSVNTGSICIVAIEYNGFKTMLAGKAGNHPIFQYVTNASTGAEGSVFSFVIADLLTSTAKDVSLSANQGRVLKGLIDNKADKTAFTGTDGTSAGTMGLVPAPATTDAGKFLKADGTWDTAGSPVNVVQTTGTSTTDVMSQNAVTSMVYADPGTKYKIAIDSTLQTSGANMVQIGAGASATGNSSVAVGRQTNASALRSIAIGHLSKATGVYGIALGSHESSTTGARGTHSIAIGAEATVPASSQGSIAFGATATVSASSQGVMSINSSNTSYGYNSSNYRLLTGLYDPQSTHDAATKGYVDTAVASAGASAFTTNEWNALWS